MSGDERVPEAVAKMTSRAALSRNVVNLKRARVGESAMAAAITQQFKHQALAFALVFS